MAVSGIIVGIHKKADQFNERLYRTIWFIKETTSEGSRLRFEPKILEESRLVEFIKRGDAVVDNAEVDGNKLKGSSGDFSRFKANGFRPIVIISEIVADNNIIGYRIATYEGKVATYRIKDVLLFCEKMCKRGYPIQNAVYVAPTENSKAYIRAFPGKTFRREIIQRDRPTNVQKAEDTTKNNERQISRLEELFSEQQIRELKLGKLHHVDIRIFGNNKLSPKQMKQLRLSLEDGINPKVFADPAFSAESMQAWRIAIQLGAKVERFINPHYNPAQIFELSTGYMSGIDISKYADYNLDANDMAKIRIDLESELWSGEDIFEMLEE